MRKCITLLACFLFLCTAVGCDSYYDWVTDVEEGLEPVDLDSVEVLHHIRITAGERVLTGVLYDTDTAKAFAAMLPLTVELWNAAPDFARAFDLPESIPRYERSGYEYVPGALAYWYDGPSIALIYHASREETVVPVVPIGRVTSDTSVFQEYGGEIKIELADHEEL